eukprot:2451775-Prymnesium_polylepis.1
MGGGGGRWWATTAYPQIERDSSNVCGVREGIVHRLVAVKLHKLATARLERREVRGSRRRFAVQRVGAPDALDERDPKVDLVGLMEVVRVAVANAERARARKVHAH